MAPINMASIFSPINHKKKYNNNFKIRIILKKTCTNIWTMKHLILSIVLIASVCLAAGETNDNYRDRYEDYKNQFKDHQTHANRDNEDSATQEARYLLIVWLRYIPS